MKPLRIHDFEMYLDPADLSVSANLAKRGKYDPATYEMLKRHLKPGHIFYDIGAHIGYFTIIGAKLVAPGGRVYSFEPDPKNFELLHKNMALNNLDNTWAFNKAVWSGTYPIYLYKSPDKTGDHRIFPDSKEKRESIQVMAISLDQFAFEPANFIKIDTQGAEYEILDGANVMIADSGPDLKMLVEFWPYGLKHCGCDPMDLLKLLQSMDFRMYDIKRKCWIESKKDYKMLIDICAGKHHFTNILCLRNKGI